MDVGSRGVRLDTDSSVDITNAAQLDTDGPVDGTPEDGGTRPDGGTGRLWAVATAVILGGSIRVSLWPRGRTPPEEAY